MNTVTTFTYWKIGSGNPFTGGYCGFDSVTVTDDGVVVGRVSTKPVGAVTISEQEWEVLQTEITAAGEQAVVDGFAWLADRKATENALLSSARSKLEAGVPLTVEEAALITRGT